MRIQRKIQENMPRIQLSVPYRDFTEEQMRAYFTKDDSRKVLLTRIALTMSVIFSVLGFRWFAYYQLFILLSLTAFIAFIALRLIIALGINVPTDEEYDAWVQKRAREELLKALQEVDQDDLPEKELGRILSIHGYAVPGIKDAKKYLKGDILWKEGRDGAKRYSINIYTYILPLEHRIVALIFHINSVNHNDHSQIIGEYFYNAVVFVQTADENELVTIEEAEYLYSTKSFLLGTSDGHSVSVTIRSLPMARESGLPGFDFIEPDVEETIRKLRRHVRSIKEQGA